MSVRWFVNNGMRLSSGTGHTWRLISSTAWNSHLWLGGRRTSNMDTWVCWYATTSDAKTSNAFIVVCLTDCFRQYFGIPSDPDDLMPSCHKKVYLDVSDVSCLHSHFGKLLNESRSRSCAQAPKTFFWEWLTRKMKDSLSRVLMLFECYITSDFIDGFSRILSELNGKTPYQVKKLVLHGCHFSELSSEKLHHLFFELINADEYIFSCISGCLDDELEFESISRFSSVQRASKLHMFGLLGEMAGMRFNGPTDEQLLDILLTENTKRYPNLTSIQLPGFNLTSGFLSKYISVGFGYIIWRYSQSRQKDSPRHWKFPTNQLLCSRFRISARSQYSVDHSLYSATDCCLPPENRSKTDSSLEYND